MAFLRRSATALGGVLLIASPLVCIPALSGCTNFRAHGDEQMDGGAGTGGLGDHGGVAGGSGGAVGGAGRAGSAGPYCGDGMINGPNEACDNGVNNGLGLGQCNPACTGTVMDKEISWLPIAASSLGGDLFADWDPECESAVGSTFRALLVGGAVSSTSVNAYRAASSSPNQGDLQVDWVLRPYTRYVNPAGELIWTTDATALLGVRDGQPMLLLHPIASGNTTYAWVGFGDDWTSGETCSHWTSATGAGRVMQLGAATIQTSVMDCGTADLVLICVEQ